uniref:hypothetical protein n=1 Tax=Aliarcobacter sp. TaxID=2321116 RepID=UPI00404868F4
MNNIKKITLVILVLISLILMSNILVDYISKNFDLTYGTTSLNQCINDPTIKDYDGILVGTSVVRELTSISHDFIYENNKYYNCGISAPTTNLTFHYVLLNILGNKINLKGKKLLLEISLQTFLKDEPMLYSKGYKSFIDFLPLKSKLFMIKDYLQYSYSMKSLEYFDKVFYLLKSFVFPVDSLRFISSESKYNPRKNHYLNVISNKDILDEKELMLYKKQFNKFLFDNRIKEIIKLAKYYEADIRFLIVPSNKIYKSRMDDNTNLDINEYINNLNNLDLRILDNNEYFADCCHYNSNGQKALLKYLKEINDN